MNLAATKVNSMAVGARRTQKAKVLQLCSDGVADHGTGRPRWIHVVVVPGLTPVKTQISSGIDQFNGAESIAGRMGQHRQPTGVVDGLNHGLSPQGLTDNRITTAVDAQRRMVELKTQGQHMDQSSLKQGTDLNPGPEGGNGHPLLALLGQPMLDRPNRPGAVVIRHSQMA